MSDYDSWKLDNGIDLSAELFADQVQDNYEKFSKSKAVQSLELGSNFILVNATAPEVLHDNGITMDWTLRFYVEGEDDNAPTADDIKNAVIEQLEKVIKTLKA